MKKLNHIFYIAVSRGIKDFFNFKTFLMQEFNAFVKDKTSLATNVFDKSMFRDVSLSSLESEFELFLDRYSDLIFQDLRFEIIDIKYLNDAYFRNPNNIETLKNRSIRKQFVYEYLLVQGLGLSSASKPISSSFWIPSTKFTQLVHVSEVSYLDGYINLIHINIKGLLEIYSRNS